MWIAIAVVVVALGVGGGVAAATLLRSHSHSASASHDSRPGSTTATTATASSSTVTTSAPTGAATTHMSFGQWNRAVMGVLIESRRLRVNLNQALQLASSGPTAQRNALVAVQMASAGRKTFLREVRAWHPPTVARSTTSLLATSLVVSIVSDGHYRRWVIALRDGDSQAGSIYTSALEYDKNKTKGAKSRFLRAFNAIRTQFDPTLLSVNLLY
jgi:hypothetical protein